MTIVSIIIVSYNARVDLERCLESLLAAPAAGQEIIVVDNQSKDGSRDAARRWPGVHVIDAASNLGFARANNMGIRASSGDNLLLLNSDTVVPSGAVERLVGILERRPDVAVVGPRLVDGSGRAELSFGRMLGPVSELWQQILVRGQQSGTPLLSALVERTTRAEHYPDWVSGACLLVRRADAESVGLLDERYFMYEEDVDFCATIGRRGRRILFTPAVEVVHLRGRSGAGAPEAARAAYHRSHLAFYEKHRPGWAPVLRWYQRARGVL